MLGNGLIGSAFLTQNTYFLALAGLPVIKALDINIGAFAVSLIIFPLSWMFSDKIGRRPLYLIGVGGNAIGMAVAGGLGFTSTRPAIWAVGVLLYVSLPLPLSTRLTETATSLSPSKSSPAPCYPGPWPPNSHPTPFDNPLNPSASQSKPSKPGSSPSSRRTCTTSAPTPATSARKPDSCSWGPVLSC